MTAAPTRGGLAVRTDPLGLASRAWVFAVYLYQSFHTVTVRRCIAQPTAAEIRATSVW